MTKMRDHGMDALAEDVPHLTARRVLITALGMGGLALSLWSQGGSEAITPAAAGGAVCSVPVTGQDGIAVAGRGEQGDGSAADQRFSACGKPRA